MKKFPLVSVIIPTYNRKELVIRAIQSALYQTYPHIEIIVIDDGSLDDTFDYILNFYRGNDKIICLKNDTNYWPVFSRNRGVQLSKGHFIAFLDSDDRWIDCEKISRDVSFLWDGYSIIHSKAMVLKKNKVKTISDYYYFSLLIRPLHFSTVVVSRHLLDMNKIFDASWEWAEDYEFILRIAQKAKIKYLKHYTTLWEVTSNSFSNKVRVYSNIKCLKLVIQYRKIYSFFLIGLLYHFYLLSNSIRKKILVFIFSFLYF